MLEDDLAVQMAVTNICRGLAEEAGTETRGDSSLWTPGGDGSTAPQSEKCLLNANCLIQIMQRKIQHLVIKIAITRCGISKWEKTQKKGAKSFCMTDLQERGGGGYGKWAQKKFGSSGRTRINN